MFVDYRLRIAIVFKNLKSATTILEIAINSSRLINYLCFINYVFLILCVLFTLTYINCL